MTRPPADDWSDTWLEDERHSDEPTGYHHAVDGHDDADYGEDHHYDGDVLDEVYDDHPPVDDTSGTRAGRHHQRSTTRRRRRRPVASFIAVVLAGAVVVGGGYLAFQTLPGLPDISFGGGGGSGTTANAADYPGPGSGEVIIEVPSGAGGEAIGRILAESDVVASAAAFTAVAAANPDAMGIQPGTYRMAAQMSAAGALERLLDPAYRWSIRVTLPEGLWVAEVFQRLADASDYEVADYEAVDVSELDLPAAANGELEGYLFPSTYEFGPDSTPQEQLQILIDRAVERYEGLGLTEEDMEQTVIIASIIQAEGRDPDDLPRISRVIENRLADGMELQMDSTVHFIFQERGRVGTGDSLRDNDNPYNTYRYPGLPPGPINSPGEAAVSAAMNPADGEWRFFVTIDPDTGETVFTETFAEHEQYVVIFQQWCAENLDRC